MCLSIGEHDLYLVKWVGAGYAGHRKSDGQRVTDIVFEADAARSLTLQLYPRQVA